MTADVIPFGPKPAYAPMDKPVRCMTPGHEDREARCYPGGRLCDHCITASRAAMNSDENQQLTTRRPEMNHRDDDRAQALVPLQPSRRDVPDPARASAGRRASRTRPTGC